MFDAITITRADAVSTVLDRVPCLCNRALEEVLQAIARHGDPQLPRHTSLFVE